MSGFHVVIPARYASARLPGKPLLAIAGRPMIQHVHERACASGAATVTIATDDARIAAAAEGFGARVCLTDPAHPSGTDRLAEVIALEGWGDHDVVVNLQGDEPLMPAELLDQVAGDLVMHQDADLATLATPLEDPAQVFDPNVVKVVTDEAGYALYFSRAAIPWQRDRFEHGGTAGEAHVQGLRRHIGLYAYRAGFVREFVAWPVSPLEQSEALEQLRALWHRRLIHVSDALVLPPAGVDTAEDLARVEAVLAG